MQEDVGAGRGSTGQYGVVHARAFVNEEVTVENIRASKELLNDAKPDDTLVLFIVGHGIHDTDPEGTTTSRPTTLSSPGFRPSRPGRGGRLSRCRQGLGGAPREYLSQKDRYIYNDLARRSGAIVFSSCRGGEFSYESEAVGNGFFTREILNALSDPALAEGGMVSVDRLRGKVSESVVKLSGDLQHPTVDRDNLYQKFGFPVLK